MAAVAGVVRARARCARRAVPMADAPPQGLLVLWVALGREKGVLGCLLFVKPRIFDTRAFGTSVTGFVALATNTAVYPKHAGFPLGTKRMV